MLSSLDEAFEKLKKAKEAEEEALLLGIEGMEHQAYRELMAMADYLGDFPESGKSPENQVAKCQSTVYVTGELKGGLMFFSGTSDAAFVQGELSILVNSMSNHTPCEIVVAGPQVHHFLKNLKGIISLSMTRGEGFLGIYERMREIACAHCTEEQLKMGGIKLEGSK